MSNILNIVVPVLCAITLIVPAHKQQAWAQTKADQSVSKSQAATLHSAESWRAKVKQELPLLGHRNWIMIVDSAYPLQTAAGVETLETNAPLPEVAQEVIQDLDKSIHVRPIVYMDAELPYLSDEDAPGVTRYRQDIQSILGNRAVSRLPHEQILSKVDETGKIFHILVLKTTLAIPYTSVFLQLDCKYWSAASETKLREAIKAEIK
jgi:hypothetical protein